MLHEATTSPYVDYDYYIGTYHGSKVGCDVFEFHERKAEVLLHRITFDRVKRLTEIPETVKDAICAMAEVSYFHTQKTPGVKSENIDGYSVTYENVTEKSVITEMSSAARNYLEHTGLLFKGRSMRYDNEC